MLRDDLSRDGAEAARLAHNQEAAGSSPAPATSRLWRWFSSIISAPRVICGRCERVLGRGGWLPRAEHHGLCARCRDRVRAEYFHRQARSGTEVPPRRASFLPRNSLKQRGARPSGKVGYK